MTLPRIPPKALRLLQVAVLIALMALLWNVADGQDAWALLQKADPLWLFAAGLVLTLQTILSAQRWRITAERLGLRLSTPEAIREYYLSQVVNQSLPGGFLGDANRAVRARHQAGLVASGQAVIFERVAGQVALVIVLIMGLVLSLLVPTAIAWPTWVRSGLQVGLVTFMATALAAGLLARFVPVFQGPTLRTIEAFRTAVLAKEVLPQQAALSFGTTLCNIAAFVLCATALGLAIPAVAALVIVPLILFAMLIPVSVSGWGLREGAAALLFPVFGAAASEGLATSVAFGVVFLITVVPGLVVIWMRPNAPVLGPH